MVQQLLVGLIFLGALAFLATLVVRSFRAEAGCGTGCAKCDGPAVIKPRP